MSDRWKAIDRHLKSRKIEQAQKLLEVWVAEIRQILPFDPVGSFWAIDKLAKVYRKKKEYQKEIELLNWYVTSECENPDQISFDLIARLKEVEIIYARYVPDRGMCEMCDTPDRALTRIDSGHVVCLTCLREISPPRSKDLATMRQIWRLRHDGIDVPDDLTREQLNHIYEVRFSQQLGLPITMDSSQEEIDEAMISVVKTFRTNVVGILYSNKDGSCRQDNIYCCNVGDEVDLIREPDNPFDPRAVMVCRKNSYQIGYLKAEILGNSQGIGWCIADNMDKGITYKAKIAEIYEFERGRKVCYGAQIEVTYHPYLIELPDDPESGMLSPMKE